MPALIQPLPPGPLDIIGDVHGEKSALLRLLAKLGCDPERGTAERPVVFVGDLVDRGPDSPGVVSVVQRLVGAGIGHCVVGNHELNILVDDAKQGNGWYFGQHDDHHPLRRPDGSIEKIAFPSVFPSRDETLDVLRFLQTLPLALERPDLRVVHACWEPAAIDALPAFAAVAPTWEAHEQRVRRELKESGVDERANEERSRYGGLRRLDIEPPVLDDAATEDHALQNGNPIRVLTSGKEHLIDQPFFIGGRWRFVARTRWWESYEDDAAVVVGHYWRRRVPPTGDIWNTPSPWGWAGPRRNVMCVDYSVGKRYLHRMEQRTDGYDGGLAALRWPERVLVFDDLDEPVITTGWDR